MKIAIFSDNFYPELSGISDSIITLAKELARREHEIHFYVPRYSAREYRKAGIPQHELDLGANIIIHRLPSFPISSPTGQARAVIPFGMCLPSIDDIKPDIIHSQLFFGVGLEALLAAKVLRIPLIGTNHTAITEFVRYLPGGARWLKLPALAYAIWYYNRCDFVTAPSQAVFDEMTARGFRAPHEVISNPIDLETFRPDEQKIEEIAETKKKFRLSGDTVVYAGRLADEKNIDTIIRAIALVKETIPSVDLAVAGHGAAEAALRNLARSLGITDRVHFVGTLDKATLAKLYRAAKLFSIMSTSETQSLTLMQALGCGLPAIGARARALPEYITSENGLLVEPGDYRALAGNIISILQDDRLAARLRKGALEKVRQYSTQRIADHWEGLYKKMQKG